MSFYLVDWGAKSHNLILVGECGILSQARPERLGSCYKKDIEISLKYLMMLPARDIYEIGGKMTKDRDI